MATAADQSNLDEILAGMIDTIRTNEDTDALKALKRQVRRRVPLHLRGYLLAFLVKGALSGNSTTTATTTGRSGRRRGARPEPRRASTPVDEQDRDIRRTADGSLARMFVNIGRSRRVHARDLTRLFADSLGIDQDAIGDVKVLDSYSFVEIPADKADLAISGLSGSEFKGRTIAVNHARKKE